MVDPFPDNLLKTTLNNSGTILSYRLSVTISVTGYTVLVVNILVLDVKGAVYDIFAVWSYISTSDILNMDDMVR